jgi:hypothetical protein
VIDSVVTVWQLKIAANIGKIAISLKGLMIFIGFSFHGRQIGFAAGIE